MKLAKLRFAMSLALFALAVVLVCKGRSSDAWVLILAALVPAYFNLRQARRLRRQAQELQRQIICIKLGKTKF